MSKMSTVSVISSCQSCGDEAYGHSHCTDCRRELETGDVRGALHTLVRMSQSPRMARRFQLQAESA